MKKNIFWSLFFVILGVVSAANAAVVTLTGIGEAQVRDGVYAGMYEFDIDGFTVLAMCDDRLTSVHIGDSWQASFFTFADIQSGAPVKFASAGIEKYSQAGYLMSLLPVLSKTERADINLAIWEIMTPGSTTLTTTAQSYYNIATSGLYDTFNFSSVMKVLTPDPVDASQEYLVPTIPIPSAVWLFGSGIIGLVGIARRKWFDAKAREGSLAFYYCVWLLF